MSYELRQIRSSRTEPLDPLDRGAQTLLSLTSFYGGKDGRCVQLTMHNDFIGLTESDVRRLVATLALWLDPDVPSPEASRFFTTLNPSADSE